MLSQNGSIDGSALTNVVDGPGRPDPEVPERLERARRRQFTVGYKLRILSEADAARTTGEIGALLLLTDELGETARAQRAFAVLGRCVGGNQAVAHPASSRSSTPSDASARQ